MRNSIALKISLITGAVVILLVLTVASIIQSDYQTEYELLFIPKNTAISENFDAIVAGAEIIPQNLSFRDWILETNGLENENEALPVRKQKNLWESGLNFNRLGKSAILKISAFGKNPMETEFLGTMVTRGLVDSLGHYYNLRSELAVRIIDGPVTFERSAGLNFWEIISGIIIGILAAFLTFIISKIVVQDKISIRLKPLGTFMPKFELPKFEMAKKPEVKKEPVKEEKFNPFLLPDYQKRASAPVNLPTVDDFINKQIEKVIENGIIKTEMPEESLEISIEKMNKERNFSREATPEEVKERLNKLLRGDF
ncbi:MAG: hypothetical protein NTZ97_05115 [Candidatus Moranbacteria bacterium]|nr:hypothetical protein [Candidatus Moranbacteria bacterium]